MSNNEEYRQELKSYNGNINLKRTNQEIDWTPELVQEYVKCQEDIVYFVETYMKIISIDKGLVNFKLYDYQKEMLQNFALNRFNIVTTARQAGKSTTTCAFILWFIIFHPEKTVALLANKGDTAQEILGRIELAYQHLPKWLQHGVVKWNKRSLELENNSRVIAAATSSDAIRGYSINLLFIDEAAFIDNWDEFFTSVFPTISSGKESKIILVSTPNGLNHFHKIWEHAVNKRNNYQWIQVPWFKVPGRDEKWKEDILSGMNFDTEKFSQEHECEFLGSSGTLIAGWKLKELLEQQPINKKDGLSQYEYPKDSHIYTIVCDVSRGKGLDYSAFQVIDVTTMPYKQVATYRNNAVGPTDFAEVINRVGRGYNYAYILVEINDMGEHVAHALSYDFAYENLLFTENAGRSGKRLTAGFASGQVDKGIRTTKIIKSLGCSMTKLLIEGNQLILNDDNTIMEFKRFSKRHNSYEAEQGAHDDLVMCVVLFAWMTEQQYFKDVTNIQTLKALREKTDEEFEQDMSPFGFILDGRDSIDRHDTVDLRQKGPDSWIWQEENDEERAYYMDNMQSFLKSNF